jgi:hypothetical protein
MRGYTSSCLLGLLLLNQGAPRRHSAPRDAKTEASPETRIPTVVPAGAIIALELKNTVNSRTAYVEQAIYAETIFPVVVGEHILIPVHSYVRGEVTEVIRPGRVSGRAKLGLRCNLIVLPDGTTRAISARVSSLGGSRIQPATGGESDGESAKSSDDGTLVDASALTQQSAILDASGVLDPSVSGAAEGVGGLVMTLATRGRTIILRPGLTFELQLTQPVDLKPAATADASKRAR